MLTKEEKNALNRFVQDERMVEAVKKVLLSVIYHQGTIKGIPTRNFILDLVPYYKNNAKLGSVVRASFMATKLLEKGFKELAEFGREKKQGGGKENPAR